jgi:sugar porter (SP) family MFS transporter
MTNPTVTPGGNALGSIRYLVLVCLVATLGGLLFGYDTAVISGAIGFLETRFALDSTWSGWAASSALAGCVLGAAVAGMASDRFGRRGVLVVSAILFLVSAIGTAIPRNLTEFILFRIVGGVGVGAASMTSPMYIAEISPARIRGRMVSVNQFAIIFGMLLVYFVNYFIAEYGAKVDAASGATATQAWNVLHGWRWMFGSGALPATLLLVLLAFVPESPRWLVKQGRADEAESILTRVDGSDNARAAMAEIQETLGQEPGSLAELVSPGIRVAMMIGLALAVLQQVTGINVMLYYGAEIFKRTGIETNQALLWEILVGATMLAFTVVAIWTVDRLGRKPLMVLGAAGMGVSLAALGLAFYLQAAGTWALVFVLGYIACFALSVGPVTWVILTEIFPTKIRGRAMGIATVALWTANLVVSQTFPMMNDDPWLVEHFHRGFPFWVYAVFCLALVAVVWRAVPETKGKTLEQIEQHWFTHSTTRNLP